MASDAASIAAGAHAARARLNKRPKISLNDFESARLKAAAKARNMKPAQFMRMAILEAITASEQRTGAMAPAQSAAHLPAVASDTPTVRKKLFVTADENSLLVKEAKAAGLLQQDYMRQSVVAAMTNATPPKRKAVVSKNELAHEISMIAFQLKKIGTNINQLSKQANTGLVPITRSEILYFMNMHQRVLTLSVASLEKVLA